MSVKRYTFVGLAHIRQMGTEAFVDAADYDALAAELAETQRQLKMVAPIGTYNGRDIEGWAKHAGALETALREHNEGCQALCGIGDQEAVACGYRPYFENSGRRCPNCPTHDIIDFPVETEPKLLLGCHRSHPHEDMDAGCQRLTEIAREANERANKGQEARCWECGMATPKAHYDDCPLAKTPAPDIDPTPWCSGCGAMRKADCKCGPLAANE